MDLARGSGVSRTVPVIAVEHRRIEIAHLVPHRSQVQVSDQEQDGCPRTSGNADAIRVAAETTSVKPARAEIERPDSDKSAEEVADGVFGEDCEMPQVVKPMVRRGRFELPTHGFSVQDDEDE